MSRDRVSAIAVIAALLLAAVTPARAQQLTDGLTPDQVRTLTFAMEHARKQSRACFEDVELPGGMVMLNLSLDGATGHITVTAIDAPPVAATVEACVKAVYAAQTGPTFDGPPHTTTIMYRPRDRY